LKLAEEFIALRNYNGAREVYAGKHLPPWLNFEKKLLIQTIQSGLSVSAVKRLKDTWEELPKPTARIFSTLEELLSPSLNYKSEREATLEGINGGHGCVPFFGSFISFSHQFN